MAKTSGPTGSGSDTTAETESASHTSLPSPAEQAIDYQDLLVTAPGMMKLGLIMPIAYLDADGRELKVGDRVSTRNNLGPKRYRRGGVTPGV